MSLLEAQTLIDPISGGLPQSTTTPHSVDLMSDDDPMQMEKPETQGLDAHDQARDLINLIQCPQCSKPFTSPVTLPCGNSLCRTCLPEPHQRLQVTYPDTPGRRRAILCPYPTCALEHTVADCSVDVTLSKVMIAISEVVAVQNELILEMQKAQQEHEQAAQTRRDSTTSEMQVSNVSARGRLVATR